MSDRLAVFNRGRIEQVGAPADVYERPATRVRRRLRRDVEPAPGRRRAGDRRATRRPSPSGRRRSGWPSRTTRSAPTRRRPLGHIRSVVYLGPDTRYVVALDAGRSSSSPSRTSSPRRSEALALRGQGCPPDLEATAQLPRRRRGRESAPDVRRDGGGAHADRRILAARGRHGLVVGACSSGATPSPSRPRQPAGRQPAGGQRGRAGRRQRGPSGPPEARSRPSARARAS